MISRKTEARGAWCVARGTCKILLLMTLVMIVSSPLLAYERRSAVVDTVAKAGPAVVNIRTEQIVQRRSSPFFGFGDSFFDDFLVFMPLAIVSAPYDCCFLVFIDKKFSSVKGSI